MNKKRNKYAVNIYLGKEAYTAINAMAVLMGMPISSLLRVLIVTASKGVEASAKTKRNIIERA